MTTLLRLTVLTPVETLWAAEDVRRIQVQLADGGGLGILPGHAPLLAETVTAPLRYTDAAGEQSVNLMGGLLQIEPGQVTIFTSGMAAATDMAAASGKTDKVGAAYGRLAHTLLTGLDGNENDDASTG